MLKKRLFIAVIAIISIFVVNLTPLLANDNQLEMDNQEPCIHLFYKQDCPQCLSINEYLDEIEDDYSVNIEKYNVDEAENEETYELFKDKYGLVSGAYPILFIGDNYLVGNSAIEENLENQIINCYDKDCICPLMKIKGTTSSMPQSREITPEDPSVVNLPIVGEINFSATPIAITTGIIAFIDGFNPCSLWLITFLLGIVIYTRSKKKIFIVGGTFLLVTGTAYAAFMAGLLNVFTYVGYLNWIQIVVAMMAFIFAAVNIKDYFWYKKGISFTIPDKFTPKIFKNVRGIMKSDKSTWQMVVGTTILALGVVLVELPCTAGFPLIWTNILAQSQIQGMAFYSLLLLYISIYLLVEIIILLTAIFTLKSSRFEEKHGRILKLIGGVIMLALGLVMLIDPNLMHNIGGTILIFASAIALSFVVIFIHRKLLPKFGVKIGTEKEIIEKATKDDGQEEDNNNENNNLN